jgi:hypothetical protein
MTTVRSMKFDARPRHGASSLEVLVAFTLLTTVLSAATPLVVRHGRMLTAQRQYRISLDELSNQLDRLSGISEADLPTAIERLAPSDFAKARLPGVELNGEFAVDDVGTRITLRISWDEPRRREAPLALTAWVMSVEDRKP